MVTTHIGLESPGAVKIVVIVVWEVGRCYTPTHGL